MADAVADECQDIVSKFLWLYFLETDPERKVCTFRLMRQLDGN